MNGRDILWRDSDGFHEKHADGRRAYGDFRSYDDVGGGREALAPPGRSWGTKDATTAEGLYDARLADLLEKRRGRAGVQQERKVIGLRKLASLHLKMKNRAGNTVESHMKDLEQRLRVAVDHFGAERDPATITAGDVREWLDKLAKRPSHKGGTLKPTTIRGYLWALSGLFGRAQEQGYVAHGYNPAKAIQEKPRAAATRAARFFEVAEAALILEAAKVVEARSKSTPGLHAIVATFLLTGGRKSEVFGLDVEDVSFDRGKIHFRPNEHRRLKTDTSHRQVPIWPQLHDILQGWLFGGSSPRASGLLFPSRHGGMVYDINAALDSIAELVGLEEGDIRTKMLRHTYCSARLQTVERIVKPGKDPKADDDAYEWIPVTPFQVAKEMGHGGHGLVQRVYGHAAENPHRSDVVEYRVDQHRDQLGERLKALEVAG